MQDDIKKSMLKEFEKQIDEIISSSYTSEFDFDQIINHIAHLKHCWQLCRIDLQNKGITSNAIRILENNNDLNIQFPEWFKGDSGQGCQIHGHINKLSFKFQCINDGTLKINLRGVDYRNLENIRRPVYVNITTLKMNNELIFDDNELIWHDQPYPFETLSKDNDMFVLSLEFKTIFDYYPFLAYLFSDVKNVEEFYGEYRRFKKQVKFIQFLEKFDEFNNSSLEMYDFMKNDNELSLGKKEENLSSYDSFLNHYANYLNSLDLKNQINQLNSKIESLENKLRDYESIIDSDNVLFNTIFLDYTLKPNKLLFDVQTLCLELLTFINKICEKYDIGWWLDYGTLLGSIRHESFIPWDDDIDIGMVRKDYHRFIEILYDELEKNNLMNYIDVGYRWRKHNGKVINSFLQFYIRDEKIEDDILLAGVDVFPYDFMGKYDDATFGDEYNNSTWNFYKRLGQGFDFSAVYMGLDYSEVIDKYYQELSLTYDENLFIIPGVEGAFGYNGTNLYELNVFKYSDMFPLKKSRFREYVFPVPYDSHTHLKKIYGENYMKVPKNVRTHYRLSLLRDIPNIEVILEKYITALKNANENFKY